MRYYINLFNSFIYWSNRLDTFNLLIQNSNTSSNFFVFRVNETECFVYSCVMETPVFIDERRGPVLVLSRGLTNSKPLTRTTFIRISAHLIMSVLVEHATLFNTSHTHRRTSRGRAGHHAANASGWRHFNPGGYQGVNELLTSSQIHRRYSATRQNIGVNEWLAGGSEA